MGSQGDIHEPLEIHWGSIEAKGENPVLPMATGLDEGSLWSSVRCEGHVPGAICQVQCGNEPASPQPFSKVIHLWQGVAIELRDGVQFPEVVAKPQTSIGFGYYNDPTGTGVSGFFYNPFLEHPHHF